MIKRRPLPWLMALSLSLVAVAGGHAQRGARRDQPLKEAVALQQTFASVADQVFPSIALPDVFRAPAEPAPPVDVAPDAVAGAEPIGVDQRYPNMRRLASASGLLMTADGYRPHQSRLS